MVYIHATFAKNRERITRKCYNLWEPVWHKRLLSLGRREGFYQYLLLTDAQYLLENPHFRHSSLLTFHKKTLSAYSFLYFFIYKIFTKQIHLRNSVTYFPRGAEFTLRNTSTILFSYWKAVCCSSSLM